MNAIRRTLLRRQRGSSESAGCSLYQPGDEALRIDWRATARTGVLLVRRCSRNIPLSWAAVVDRSPSMLVGRKRSSLASAQEAAHFWYGCAAGDDRRIHFPAGKSIAAALCDAIRMPPESALLIVSDFWNISARDPVFAQLARRFDCTVLFARDPWISDLPLHGFIAVRDIQSGDARELYVGATQRRRYLVAARARELASLDALRHAQCRVAVLVEGDGARSVLRAFQKI